MSTPTPFAGGTYTLFNDHHGKALTAVKDAVEVVGEPYAEDKLLVQQWEFIPFSGGFVIRLPLLAKRDGPAFLTFEGKLSDGQIVKLGTHPMVWNVSCKREDNGSEIVRLCTSRFHVDLDYHAGRKVQLIHYKQGEKCQRWYARRCDFTTGLRRSLLNSHVVGGLDLEREGAVARNRVAPGPGPHILLNGAAGRALDVSAQGRRAIKCWSMHKERNQQWEFIPIGDTTDYAIRSGIEAFDGRPLYLTVEAPAKERAAVVASPYPVPWRVEWSKMDASGDAYRLHWPGTNFFIAVDGTQEGANVRLTGFSPNKGQLWQALLL
ncbi:hypothetical protein C8Q73DRAFT_795434 [Cubamyces lactineus]|nr:hypothetical protein C8Q73DRAFT_795434 [Cubamyces lactineus]